MKFISTPDAPTPAGHYSQAVRHNGLIYISGQLSIDPASGQVENGPIEAQTRLILKNFDNLLRASGSDKEHVLKVTIYISNIELWGAVNEVYSEFFGKHKPARAVVPVNELHFGCLLELEAVAAEL